MHPELIAILIFVVSIGAGVGLFLKVWEALNAIIHACNHYVDGGKR